MALRGELVDLVVGELCGPAGGEDEVLVGRQRPRDRYLAGVIAPPWRATRPRRDETLTGADADNEDDGDTEEAAARSTMPSSIGLTCHVAHGTPALVVRASWGRYERVPDPDEDRPDLVWRRMPEAGEVTVPVDPGG